MGWAQRKSADEHSLRYALLRCFAAPFNVAIEETDVLAHRIRRGSRLTKAHGFALLLAEAGGVLLALQHDLPALVDAKAACAGVDLERRMPAQIT